MFACSKLLAVMPHRIARFQRKAEMSTRLHTRLKQALRPHDPCLAVMPQPLSRLQTTLLITCQNPSSQIALIFHDVRSMFFSTSIFCVPNLHWSARPQPLRVDPMLLLLLL